MNKLLCYIKCRTGANIPDDLDIEQPTEWRKCVLNLDHVVAYYPSKEENECYVDMINGSEYTIRGNFEKLDDRIE